ncbi:MAG TPA: PHP domain-containing protein [Symbiobacteriaceae bacterium]|nr:PHP domain-containing protein [Symbiobacteriaceae bacterium]
MKSNPFTGRYLFHLHTTYTDGHVPVQSYFNLAVSKGLDRLIFLEHIRAAPRYDVAQFIAEVRGCAAATGVEALVGFEAKVLPGGGLDISPDHLAAADVIGIAEHGFPADFDLWRTAVRQALDTCGRGNKPAVWVHPGLWLKKHWLLAAQEQEYRALLRHAQDAGVLVEVNRRYGLLPAHLLGDVAPGALVRGADAHRMEEAEAEAAEMSGN